MKSFREYYFLINNPDILNYALNTESKLKVLSMPEIIVCNRMVPHLYFSNLVFKSADLNSGCVTCYKLSKHL